MRYLGSSLLRRVIVPILFLGLIILGIQTLRFFWANFPDLPPQPVRLTSLVDEGTVCFEQGADPLELHGTVEEACALSCGSRVIDSAAHGSVDASQKALHLESNFTLADDSPERICDQGCGQGATVKFDLGSVDPGVYTVWLGEKQIGQLLVPAKRPLSCFPSSPADPNANGYP